MIDGTPHKWCRILEDMGLTMIPFGQGYKDMSPPSKELFKLMMEGRIQHGGQPVFKMDVAKRSYAPRPCRQYQTR